MGQRWHQRLLGERNKLATLVILVVTAALMLSGLGKAVVSATESLGKSDRLAAISLLLSGKPDEALPVTFLDVDDAARSAWGATAATPHGALAALISLAAESGAKGILLDFDLANDQPGAPANPALAGVLQGYAADAPVLMLVRRINTGAAAAIPTPYDGLTLGKPNIVWVTTLTDASSDRTVRRIRLWETVCDGSDGVAYPSVAMATAATLLDGGGRRAAMESFLDSAVQRTCGGVAIGQNSWPPVHNQLVRVPFVVGFDPQSNMRLRIDVDGAPTVAFWRVPASRVVRMEEGRAVPPGEIDASPFAGRVAVIGGSYSDSGDIYVTPLGVMPGAMVLANSILQARAMVERPPASLAAWGFMTVGLFLAFAAVARFFVPLVAVLVIAIVSVGSLLALSRLFGFETAIEALASALTGFGLFKLADMLVNLVSDFPRRGFKAVFKP